MDGTGNGGYLIITVFTKMRVLLNFACNELLDLQKSFIWNSLVIINIFIRSQHIVQIKQNHHEE